MIMIMTIMIMTISQAESRLGCVLATRKLDWSLFWRFSDFKTQP